VTLVLGRNSAGFQRYPASLGALWFMAEGKRSISKIPSIDDVKRKIYGRTTFSNVNPDYSN
jgi:hypothetical protein